MPPWVFDVVVVAVILLSAVMSIGRGLIREIFSILAFVIGGLSAWFCITLGSGTAEKGDLARSTLSGAGLHPL